MDFLYLSIGLIVLVVGGELTLRGAIGLARLLGVSTAIIGLTVMGFGTSAPELVVTVRAVLTDNVDIAVGNAVGSNIANSLLILGVGALIAQDILGQPSRLLEPFRFSRYAAGDLHPVSNSPYPWS